MRIHVIENEKEKNKHRSIKVYVCDAKKLIEFFGHTNGRMMTNLLAKGMSRPIQIDQDVGEEDEYHYSTDLVILDYEGAKDSEYAIVSKRVTEENEYKEMTAQEMSELVLKIFHVSEEECKKLFAAQYNKKKKSCSIT